MTAASKVRVLFITRAYGVTAGGMERLSWELIQACTRHPHIEAHTIALEMPQRATKFTRRVKATIFALSAIPEALRVARSSDVIHLGDPALAFLGWLIQKVTRKPVAITVHGLDITYSNFLYQLYLKAFFRNLDTYLPISTKTKELLTKHHNVITPVTVITPAAHDSHYKPSIKRPQLEQLLQAHNHPITASATTLLTTGRLVARKGHTWFIRNVLPKLPLNTHYLIVGEGPERTKIETAIRESNMNDQVALLGKVNDNDLSTLYNTVDAFIQPNIKVTNDVEGFGLVLIEAALCERPVFAANIDGIPSAIHHQQNGILIESENAAQWFQTLQTFLQNPAQHQPSGPQVRTYTRANFSWEKTSNSYADVFKNLATHS